MVIALCSKQFSVSDNDCLELCCNGWGVQILAQSYSVWLLATSHLSLYRCNSDDRNFQIQNSRLALSAISAICQSDGEYWYTVV